MKRFSLVFFIFWTMFFSFQDAWTAQYPEVMFILDASGSMWGTAGNKTKMEAARNAFSKVVPALPKEVRIGLTAYGHRTKGDCSDIEILIPPGSDDRAKVLSWSTPCLPKARPRLPIR